MKTQWFTSFLAFISDWPKGQMAGVCDGLQMQKPSAGRAEPLAWGRAMLLCGSWPWGHNFSGAGHLSSRVLSKWSSSAFPSHPVRLVAVFLGQAPGLAGNIVHAVRLPDLPACRYPGTSPAWRVGRPHVMRARGSAPFLPRLSHSPRCTRP